MLFRSGRIEDAVCFGKSRAARTELAELSNHRKHNPEIAPAAGPQTRYEALRAYLFDGEPAATVAARFGYSTAGLTSAVADFRAGARSFFLDARPGPKSAPGKDAARTRIIALRAQGYSIDEIAAALAAEGTGLIGRASCRERV